ncbi:hypothetical protein FOTG_08578 [Fusarium oxysporum f. sp. vasinfectum 25433]|uniref:Uncharacterized protein n=1 Tax=Fusarium oxysporum f. sp. vasinfectum 25433 TaxID=1089449 RepID=X0LF86_FUSOX|nr:hypothetical protein FOTG_08578 [Fusarium oxysporum f. sp. vasinfectum 25433]
MSSKNTFEYAIEWQKGDVDVKTEESVSKGELEVVNFGKKQGAGSRGREVIGAEERF